VSIIHEDGWHAESLGSDAMQIAQIDASQRG
jgi:hypothetical protein